MPRQQSEDLAAETAVMRTFDRALQATGDLPAKAAGRVLRYVADRVADEQAAASPGWAGGGGGGEYADVLAARAGKA